MSLVSVRDILTAADRDGYAVPAFNAYNAETALAILNTAQKLRSPVIVQTFDRLFRLPVGEGLYNAQAVSAVIKEFAPAMNIPVALHLDHGSCLESIVKALRWGYNSVMIDGSSLPYEENIALTADIVRICDQVSIPVEGELGHVGSAKDGDEGDRSQLTVPEEAADFIARTGVSTLAVMVGSAHGKYKLPPRLDIDRIAKIKELCKIPLVLHGGSGIPDDQIRLAIEAGIRKINVATDILTAFYAGFKEVPADNELWGKALDMFMLPSYEKMEELLASRITLFGSAGRA